MAHDPGALLLRSRVAYTYFEGAFANLDHLCYLSGVFCNGAEWSRERSVVDA